MPRRVDRIIPVKNGFEVAAVIACEGTGLFTLDGTNYSERMGRIRKFVDRFVQANMEMQGTNVVDNMMGRLANKYYWYGMQRTVPRKHAPARK